MMTVVTVTPMALEADSRTFKQAATVARAGYRSIVVEGRLSRLQPDMLPFKLISPDVDPEDAVAERPAASSQSSGLRAFLQRAPESFKWPWRAVRYVAMYAIDFGLVTFRRTPPASLYYLHAFYQFPAIYCLSRRHGVPYIYDAHDFYSRLEEPDQISWSRRHLVLPFERWLERKCIKHAAAIVTVADGIADLLRETFGCESVVIRNCHDSRLDQEHPPAMRETIGIRPDDFLVVVIGRAKKGRAILELLQAVADLPDKVHVAFLGSGYQDKFADDVQRLGLAGRVHFVPPVKPFEVVPFVRSADAAAILYYARSVNYAYSLPNGFFQSVAAELPVLYPDLIEIKKVAEHFDIGIRIDPRNSQSLRAGIETLRNDNGRYEQLRRNLRKAHITLDWEKEEKKLHELLADILVEKAQLESPTPASR
jgi:glycosyltransferase involved in cell wall biosynthesis